jgi:hypothetical protein
MGPRYDISDYDINRLIITKEDLLEGHWGGRAMSASDAAETAQPEMHTLEHPHPAERSSSEAPAAADGGTTVGPDAGPGAPPGS